MKEQESVKVLRKIFNSEKWFGAFFDAVFYQDLDGEAVVFTDAVTKLKRELDDLDHKPLISMGATFEPYNNYENDYELTRKGLELVKELDFPVVIITGEELILRDLKLIEEIAKQKKAWVAVRMDHYDIALLDVIKKIASKGIKVGIIAQSSFLFESTNDLIERFVTDARDHACDFILPIYLLEDSYIQDDYKREYAHNDTFFRVCDNVGINTKMPLYDEEFMHTKQINLFDLNV